MKENSKLAKPYKNDTALVKASVKSKTLVEW
jgi:hypothetical protein